MKKILSGIMWLLFSLLLIWLGCKIVFLKYILFAIAGFIDGVLLAYMAGERKPVEKIMIGSLYTCIFLVTSYTYFHQI